MSSNENYYREEWVPETPSPAATPDPWKDPTVVGKPLPRIDAYERLSGSAVFTADVVLPNMLYAAILHCPHGHAMVKKVDISAAEKMPGVRSIMTDATPAAQIPWYSGPGGSLSRMFDPHCRYHGEEIAAVAAETPYQAWDAIRAIKVEYEILKHVVTEEDALKEGAPAVHASGNRIRDPQIYQRGNVDAGFKEADVVLEQTYSTACEIHVPTEMHGCVAKWEGNRLTVWESTQGVYTIQSQLAQTLKMPISNVRVIGHYMGGGFGSKLQYGKYTVLAALMAKQTGRPVKFILPREQTFLSVGNRPPAKMSVKAGVKKDGTLTALQLKTVATGGAYAGPGSVDFVFRDLYLCPNVRTESTEVYINAGPQRAFRAPGHPQGAWALEQMIDALAGAIQMDPVQFRLKNIPLISQSRQGQPYTTTGLADCLREGAKTFGWEEAKQRAKATEGNAIRRGVGVAAGMWQGGAGGPPSTIIVKLFADGSVNLNMGASDNGTGTKTIMAQVVSEELGVPFERILVEHADTATTQYATASGGSKTVPTEAPATRAAALEVKRQILEMAADQLKVAVADLVLKGEEVVSTSDASKKVAVNALAGLRRQGVIVGVGYREANPQGKAINPFGVHFTEVDVNTRTGEARIVRYLAVQDSGRPMNRLTFQNQTFGGVIMGIGFGMTEERILDRMHTGRVVNMNYHDYKIPTALDVPADPVCLPIDPNDTVCNSTGAKGLGEPATVPAAPAVANAIYNAIGVRLPDTPMNPARIISQLAAKQRRG